MEEARQLAEHKGWDVVDTFEDVDLSAYNTRVKRPEFERMGGEFRLSFIEGVRELRRLPNAGIPKPNRQGSLLQYSRLAQRGGPPRP